MAGNRMIKIQQAVIVEGKYDKSKLLSIIDAPILTTDGFGIFTDREKQALLSRIAAERGLVVITDSDRAGFRIRNFLKGLVPPGKITSVVLPAIEGKERRKIRPSAQGLLGVEGIEAETIRETLRKYGFAERESENAPEPPRRKILKSDFYADGLSGRDGSVERRRAFCRSLGLPEEMSATALLEAVNLLMDCDTYKAALK